MNNTIIAPVSKGGTRVAVAALGSSHGYQFDNDTVRLNAMFRVLDPAAHSARWALQLWACAEAPTSPDSLDGQLVAEVTLPPIAELADDTESFEVVCPAQLPAGQAAHVMVLALVALRDNASRETHDIAVHPRRETFLLPRLGGAVGYRIEGDRVVIHAGRVESPRPSGDLSGTLSLELWALEREHRGGAFTGAPLAGVAFDPVAGQHEFRDLAFDLPYTQPPTGQWRVVLMLREWTAAGFVTRDYSNFPIALDGVSAKSPATSAPAISAPAATQLAAKLAPAVVVEAAAKADNPVARPATVAAAAPQRGGPVSVNTASKDELAGVKGMPARVIEGIVSSRPFRSLDDLTKVKGMGAKLLSRLKSHLKL